jgi:DNA-binding MarR family transcriptional regulator
VVSRLVDAGLVERRASIGDARRAELTVTRSGSGIARRAGETVQERLVGAFESLPSADQKALARIMESWISAAGMGDTAAGFFFTTA